MNMFNDIECYPYIEIFISGGICVMEPKVILSLTSANAFSILKQLLMEDDVILLQASLPL